MLDSSGDSQDSRILDILGNKNRRRIIELLKQKPCFVTEISERLIISPKAVIEHLQLMEHENILRFNLDERRRKYYYLANNIDVVIRFHGQNVSTSAIENTVKSQFFSSLAILRKMIDARDNMINNLDQLEKDIELKANEVLIKGKEMFENEHELDIIFALGHYDLTFDELLEYTTLPDYELQATLNGLIKKGLIGQSGSKYLLRGMYAK